MKTKRTICLAILSMVLVVSSVTSAVVVDPDAFAPGTVLNTAFPGVTLSAHGDTPNSDVLSFANPLATTGKQIFAMADNDYLWGNGAFDWLEAAFSGGATQVSLDFIANDSDTNATLIAFDAGGNQVDQAVSVGTYTSGQYVTLTVSAPYIAYISAAGDPINHSDNWAIDNLVYSPVPEPATMLLLSLGGLVLRKRRN